MQRQRHRLAPMQLTVECNISQSMAQRPYAHHQGSWLKIGSQGQILVGLGSYTWKLAFSKDAPMLWGPRSSECTLKNTGTVMTILSCSRGFKGPGGWQSGSTEQG